MDKNEALALLRDVLDKFGQTAEHAWPHVIRSYYAESLISVISFVVLAILFFIGPVVAGIMIYKTKFATDNKLVGGAFLIIISITIFAGCIGGLRKNLPGIIEPEGTFIRNLIEK